MARQTIKTQTRTRVRKDGKPTKAGYMPCNVCHGTGVQKKPAGKKKA